VLGRGEMKGERVAGDRPPRIGVLERGNPADRDREPPEEHRWYELLGALGSLGAVAELVVYSEEIADDVRKALLELDGVLVWVDPIAHGKDRTQLDALLREVAASGVWVSTDPDVILQMGTKEVLHRTRALGWGTDTRLYASAEEFRDAFPRTLAEGGSRVLKQNRGNGGIGVFRVELVDSRARPETVRDETPVRVQHAQRGSAREEIRLGEFMRRCEVYFANGGRIVDQALQPRHAEGMVRCYLVQGRVAGFGHQFVTALADPLPGDSVPPTPAPRLYSGPSKPEFQALRVQLESEWVPALQEVLGIETAALPALWDADFLLGPKDASGDDTYVLCEINVSSVYPFPDEALEDLARCAVTNARARRNRVEEQARLGDAPIIQRR
jgi:hypothetical protein